MMSIDERLDKASEYLLTILKVNAPKDTWNLSINGIRILPNEHIIVIGGEIAPYAVFTNETWKEGNNPNEGWINKSIEQAIPMIKVLLSGTYTQNELDQIENEMTANKVMFKQQALILASLKEQQAQALKGQLK